MSSFRTAKPLSGGPGARPANVLESTSWTTGMFRAVHTARVVAGVLGLHISVVIVTEVTEPFSACYGGRTLTFNLGRLGHRWFDANGPDALLRVLRLVIHELAHEYAADHLSDEYHEACCKIGAALALAAVDWREVGGDEGLWQVPAPLAGGAALAAEGS